MSEARPEQAPAPRGARILDLLEVILVAALLALGLLLAREVLELDAVAERPAVIAAPPQDLIEAEALKLVARSRDFTFGLQPTDGFEGGAWSGNAQMFAVAPRRGDWLDLELPVQRAGTYDLELFLTRAADYGIVEISLNGMRVGEAIDLWARRVETTGALALGPVQVQDGRNVLRIAVTDTNPRSLPPHFQFGVDGLRLRSLPPIEQGRTEVR